MQKKLFGPALTAISVLVAATSAAAAAPIPGDAVVTRHKLQIGGKPVEYSAEAGRLPIRDQATGIAHGQMFYVAYRLPQAAGAPPRPVTFLWGGGPSGPALGALMTFGPARTAQGKVIDNPETLLSTTDLVFVDPIGTGFSRPTAAEYQSEFYSTRGDGASVAEFIRVWRATHDAETAPLFVYGISYGVWRASIVTENLEKAGTRVAGSILISGGMSVGDKGVEPEAFNTALRIPGRAAATLTWKRLPAEHGTTREQVLANAEAWARKVYAPALERIDSLTPAEKDDVAAQLASWTGLKPEQIDRKTLRVTGTQYLRAFNPGKSLVLNDMRQEMAPRGGGDGPSPRLAQMRYLRQTLGYTTDLAYLGGAESGYSPDGGPAYRAPGSQWNYNTGGVTKENFAEKGRAAGDAGEGPPGPEDWIVRTLSVNPKLKVFVGAGIYDSLNSCVLNEDIKRRLPANIAQAYSLNCYVAGHGIGDTEAAAKLKTDIAAFIRASAR